MKEKIEEFVEIIEKPFTGQPSEQETIMAVAYAISQRSTCMKRKVGAVIVDKYGTVFSTGYNEVPRLQGDCKNEYGKCYRTFIRENFEDQVGKIVKERTQKDALNKELKKSFKNLDYCRALHAEESAIINVASLGTSSGLEGATLYTTTYPCNLCANKIAQVGIKKVVYSEPYPMKEAREILSQSNVEQVPFEGVTFKGYFRLYGGDIS